MKLKDLFATPGKAVLTSLALLLLVALLGTGAVFAAENAARSKSIGMAAAERAALADAGVAAEAARISRTEFELEKGQFVYEVEFVAAGIEYDYVIKASDGTVLSRKAETGDDYRRDSSVLSPAANETTASPVQETAPAAVAGAAATEQDYIGVEAARQKALADAGVTLADATVIKEKLDYDDGVAVYEVEFFTADREYDYEINALTAAVQGKSVEKRGTVNPGSPAYNDKAAYIGVDQAKSIALDHAGLAAADVSFSKAKLENDDGMTVYEIRFFKNRTEYEYTIQAVTGDVLDFDTEWGD